MINVCVCVQMKLGTEIEMEQQSVKFYARNLIEISIILFLLKNSLGIKYQSIYYKIYSECIHTLNHRLIGYFAKVEPLFRNKELLCLDDRKNKSMNK